LTVAVALPRGCVTTRAVAVLEVAALNHEVVNDAVENGPVVGALVNVLEEGGSVRGRIGMNLNRHVTRTVGAIGVSPRQGHPNHLVARQGRAVAGLTQDEKHRQEHSAHQTERGQGGRAVLEKRGNEVFANALLGHLIQQFIVRGVEALGAAIHLHRRAEVLGCLPVSRGRARTLASSRRARPARYHVMACVPLAVGLTHEVDNTCVVALLDVRFCAAPSLLDLLARHEPR